MSSNKIWTDDHDKGKVLMSPDQPVLIKAMPFSEVCMHMGIAGKKMMAELIFRENGSAVCQLYQWREDTADMGKGVGYTPFSSPILSGEAGFYQDDGGYYGYFAKEIDA